MRQWFVAVAVVLCGCRAPNRPAVPGDTTIGVTAVTIEPDAPSTLVYKPVINLLGVRAKTLLYPERPLNEYRLAEDRRRLAGWLQGQGRFEATVDAPRVTWNAARTHVAVAWPVHEGPRYTVASVTFVGAPPEHEAGLRAILMFGRGSAIDLEPYRLQRLEMATYLQDRGFGHARAYSRTFVDRTAKTVAWFFYVDPGPQTRVGSFAVQGNDQVPAADVLERTGFTVGAPFSTSAARRAELALLDTGAFVSVNVITDADIHRLPEYPDTGGIMTAAQVSADGTLVPRTLPETLAVKVVVVEAPARQLRLEAGVEADPTRIDAFAGARLTLRNLFAPQHHLILEGNVGYGHTFDDAGIANRLYGSALVQYLHPLTSVDVRLTGRWRDVLYPSALLRELTAGPGLRAVPAQGVLLELDALYRFARTLDLPAIDPATAGSFTAADSRGVELVGSAIVDRRDDRVEPTRGWLVGLTGSFSPGGPLGDHRWLQLTTEVRGFVRLGGPWSAGMRVSAGWVLLPGDDGVPLGPRLFGGGSYGMRGFGRDRLSPAACALGTTCDRVLVGGRSLVEASVELRLLPIRKQYGAAVFVDAGGAGEATNAFASGVSLAAGVGGRLRLWYLPIALDLAYRILDEGEAGAAWGRVLAFVRIGEAF
ncbi:MAG: BamA/TamA family outer membrane protein [Polyangiales bacterium]